MKRLILIALIVAACTTGTAFATPVPDDAGSDCGWFEHGTTVQVGDELYTCHCAELTGPMGKQVLCRWYSESALPKKKIRKAKPKPHRHAVRVYPLPRVVG